MSAGYERFSAQDSSFLVFEDPNTHMHLGGIAIFDPGPLATADGGVDIERIRRHVESRLHWIPRYRQRVAYVPLERHPVWVDDDHFNLSYHVRHTSLPRPGDEEQLKRLAGRVMSQRLDRRRPLWEIWVVEGLEGGRFAMVTKTHHCMVDGVAAVDLNAVLLSPTPEHPQEEAPPWVPRPAPSPLTLLRDEALRHPRGDGLPDRRAGERALRGRARPVHQSGLGLAHVAPHPGARPAAAARQDPPDDGASQGDEPGARSRALDPARRVGRRGAGHARHAARVPARALQPDRHQHPGPAGASLHARRPPARRLSDGPAVREPGSRRRDLQLCRAALLGLQRRLGPGAGPARLRRGNRRVVPGARRGGGVRRPAGDEGGRASSGGGGRTVKTGSVCPTGRYSTMSFLRLCTNATNSRCSASGTRNAARAAAA